MAAITAKIRNIWVISDGTDSITQSMQLALNLTSATNIRKIYKDDGHIQAPYPDLAIGVGFNVTDTLLDIKAKSGGVSKIAIILDPLKEYEKFDFIILPNYEPYKITGSNVIRTTGLMNFVNAQYQVQMLDEYNNAEKFRYLRELKLQPPFLTVVIGGHHTGGNISADDALKITDKINHIIRKNGGTALITTSRRTEVQVPEIIKQNITVPHFIYDYKKREYENPYGVFLSLAHEIIVTGESVRMMSECCSTNKKIRIFRPEKYGFQYAPLIDELIAKGHAVEFDNDAEFTPNHLNEARSIADIILRSVS